MSKRNAAMICLVLIASISTPSERTAAASGLYMCNVLAHVLAEGAPRRSARRLSRAERIDRREHVPVGRRGLVLQEARRNRNEQPCGAMPMIRPKGRRRWIMILRGTR